MGIRCTTTCEVVPVTDPIPAQVPPVTLSVLIVAPLARLTMPAPERLAVPLTAPVPASVPPLHSEPFTELHTPGVSHRLTPGIDQRLSALLTEPDIPGVSHGLTQV